MQFRVIYVLFTILVAAIFPGSQARAADALIESRQISQFRVGSDQRGFGSLEFVGGIEMSSPDNPLFGAWSAIRLRPDGRGFAGVLDTGHWITGRLERDAQGRLNGLGGVAIVKMRDASGGTGAGKGRMDGESLALRPEGAFVGFEQRHRVDLYPGEDFMDATPARSLALPFSPSRLRGNGGLEALAVSPLAGPLKGAIVAVAEKSLDKNGYLYAGILDGDQKGAFSVVRSDDFDVTDGAFLPDGDLLLLQRRFSLATGVALRIARIAATSIRPGAIVEPEILLEAGSGFQIDNMEGIDVFTGSDGATRVILVSDDNHSILQRNLMLEFRLLP